MDLAQRGWSRVSDGKGAVPLVEVWRKCVGPLCVELELWDNGNIRGRLCSGEGRITGGLQFDNLSTIDEVAQFLEKLLDGAAKAFTSRNGEPGLP